MLKTENDDFEKLSYKYVHRPTKYEAFANKMIPMNYTIFQDQNTIAQCFDKGKFQILIKKSFRSLSHQPI